MKQRRILIVDDEPEIRRSLAGVLEDEGYLAGTAENGEACLDALPGAGFELVLLDIWLPGIDGMEVLERIQAIPFAERPKSSSSPATAASKPPSRPPSWVLSIFSRSRSPSIRSR